MRAYRIVEWNQRYEVNKDGRAVKAPTAVEDLKKTPLDYYRGRVFGRNPGPSARRAMRAAEELLGPTGPAILFGVWEKLQEVAAQEYAGWRGWILDEKRNPVDARQFAEMVCLGCPVHVEQIMQILCSQEVAWIEYVEFAVDSAEFREKPREEAATCGNLQNRTEDKPNLTKPKPKEDDKPVFEEGSLAAQVGANIVAAGSDSASAPPVGISDSVRRARERASDEIVKIFAMAGINILATKSDVKAFYGLFEQVEEKVRQGVFQEACFGRMVQHARQCCGGEKPAANPVGAFFTRMKKRFDYRRGFLGRVFSR